MTKSMEELKSKLEELKKQKAPLEKKRENLWHQITPIETEIADIKESMKVIHSQFVVKHIDALLELVPDHDCTSCNDNNRRNVYENCTRCTLLEAKDMGYLDPEIELEIKIKD